MEEANSSGTQSRLTGPERKEKEDMAKKKKEEKKSIEQKRKEKNRQ